MLFPPALLGLPPGLVDLVHVDALVSEEGVQDVCVPVLGRHHERGVAEFVGDVDVDGGVEVEYNGVDDEVYADGVCIWC